MDDKFFSWMEMPYNTSLELMLQVGVSSLAWIGYYSTYPQNPSYAQFWEWTDRTPSIYSLWTSGSPNNVSICAHMRSSGSPYNNGNPYWDGFPERGSPSRLLSPERKR